MTYYPTKQINYSLNLPTENPLFKWASTGNLEELKNKIKTLEDIDAKNSQGNSLNKVAANHQQQAVLDWFYQLASNFFSENGEIDCHRHDDKQRTIIHWAAKCNQSISVFEYLISKNANINQADNSFQVTPLYLAASDNCPLASQALISLGTDINAQAVNGATALHVACENGNSEIISQLMAGGADINKACLHNGTPLFIAAKKGHLNAVNALIAANADLEKAYDEKFTPLVIAMENQRVDIVKALLAAKAKTDYQLHNGWSLKQFAEELKNPKLIELF